MVGKSALCREGGQASYQGTSPKFLCGLCVLCGENSGSQLAISPTPPGLFERFIANKALSWNRPLGLACVTLGWPLGHAWATQGSPKPNPSRQRVADFPQVPNTTYQVPLLSKIIPPATWAADSRKTLLALCVIVSYFVRFCQVKSDVFSEARMLSP